MCKSVTGVTEYTYRRVANFFFCECSFIKKTSGA